MKSKRDSGTAMFLMEMIAVVCFFILCASICILVFVRANNLSRLAKDTNYASLAAESVAEVWKAEAADGLRNRLGLTGDDTSGVVYWDSQWNPVKEEQAHYGAWVEMTEDGLVGEAQIRVLRLEDDAELFALTVKRILRP